MEPDFESKFHQWFALVGGHDPQVYQDVDWNWEEEIFNFINDPGLALKNAEDEFGYYDKNNEEYFTNTFGIKMKRQK